MLQMSRKREAILRAGLGLFARRGYEATSVPDILARAGATIATFYKYFPTKSRLAFEIYERLQFELDAALGYPPLKEGPPQEQLKELVARMFEFAKSHGEVLDFLFLGDHRSYLKDSGEMTMTPRTVREVMEDLARQGALKNVSPSFLTTLFWGAFLQVHRVGPSALASKRSEVFAACMWDALRRTNPGKAG